MAGSERMNTNKS